MNLTKEFWEKAYKENASKMIGVCRRYVKDKDIAEDLMQDAFLTAINKANTYTGKGCFDAWLRRIAVNSALMYLRNKNTRKIYVDLIENEGEYQNMDEPNANDIRSIIENADFSDKELLGAIDNLPEHHKLVFNLYVIDNYTHIQIGKELNISSGTSKSHLARARKKIQQLLYQKALEKNQEQNKRKSAILLFISPFKLNYIDKLLKGKLNNYSVEPVNKTFSFSGFENWDRIKIPKERYFYITKKINYWIIVSITGIIITVVLYNSKNTISSSVVPELNSINRVKPDSIIQQNDSHNLKPKNEVIFINEDSIQQTKTARPVIVKKIIIQRKIITIRDTLKIIDTTNAK